MQSNLLRKGEVCHLLGGIHYATLYRGVRSGRYPKPLHVGPGSSRWLRSEIEACLKSMVEGRS
jgi:predicted DNA-binding transcriptional regulator AlpA